MPTSRFPPSHTAVILGAPLLLGVLEIGHPALLPGEGIFATIAPITVWWTALHVVQIPLFALVGLAVLLVVRDLRGRPTQISRGAVCVFIVVYPAFDAAVGVSSGIIVHTLSTLEPPQRATVEA